MRTILALVAGSEKAARRERKSIKWLEVEKDILAYLQGEGDENWRSKFTPLVSGLVNDVGRLWATELGVQFDIRNLRGEEWFEDYMLKFAQPINETTSDDIHRIIAQALEEGWSISDMTKHLEDLFVQYMQGDLTIEDFAWLDDRMPEYRREMIARTETMRASNAGAYWLGKDWGVTYKEWLATGDDRTREAHRIADGQIKPIDTPFQVGGFQMMYPLDGSLGAPAYLIVKCRCGVVLLPLDYKP